jgi:hypothetical protein
MLRKARFSLHLIPFLLLASGLASGANAATISFALVADAGKINANSKMVRDSVVKSGLHSLVMAGDNAYDTSKTYPEIWNSWRNAGLNFDVTALGNHNRGYQEEMAYFSMPAENFSVTRNPGIRFIVLNSDNTRSVERQISWLKSELEAATEPAVFLVYHHPTYTISSRHHWKEKKKFQEAIRPLLRQYRDKITGLIIGHDHIATLVHFEDLPAIVSGATQDPKKDQPVSYADGLIRVRTAWLHQGTQPFWIRLEVNDQTGDSQLHFIDATDQHIACSAEIRRGEPARLQSNCTP